MTRVLLMILATIGLVVFAFANMERVELSFVFGRTETRLTFLLGTSFTTGALAALFYQTLAGARRRARKNRIRVARKRVALKEAEAE